MNRVMLTGKVASLPERHYRPDGSPVIQFFLELDDSEAPANPPRQHRDKGRNSPERIAIVAFEKLAEHSLDLLPCGQPVMVIGKLNQRNWQTPEGKKKSLTEVIATEIRVIEDKTLIEEQIVEGE